MSSTEPGRAVYCPECGARPGDACLGARQRPRAREHKVRRDLARPTGPMRFAVHAPNGEFCGFIALDFSVVGGEGTFKEVGEGEPKEALAVSSIPPQEAEGPGTTSRIDIEAAYVGAAWETWLRLAQPRRKKLPEGTAKQLRRAFKAEYSLAQLETMMEALLASDWHRERDQLTLSTIFATRPGGKTFEDQLDTWLARGESPSSSPAAGDATVTDAAVAAAKNTVRQTWGRDSKAAVQLRDAAVGTLRHHGWKISSSSNGQPMFSRV